MKNNFLQLVVFAFSTLLTLSANAATPTQTATGIPLDTAWKQQVYDFALKNVVHPSWGIAHSERDYQVTKSLSKKEAFALDEEVLFVAAFLHDIGGIPPFDKKGVDHAERSLEVIEPLLTQWGFPMQKWTTVKEMILGHVYYGPAPSSLPAQAFRDADIIDFMGSIGIARILAITLEPGHSSPTLKPTVGVLKDFITTLPKKCSLQSCTDIALERQAEMIRFMNELDKESFMGSAL